VSRARAGPHLGGTPDGETDAIRPGAGHGWGSAARSLRHRPGRIYQCLNAPYNQWPERFPPLQRGVLAAAERTGALLVSLENLYGYGPVDGRPMTEELPLAATGAKGRARRP
jgi:hypothetical protein